MEFAQLESISELNEICRLCITNPKTDVIFSTALTSPFEEAITYTELIKLVSSNFEPLQNNDFFISNGICNDCAQKLINFYEFKLLIENSQMQLENLFSKSNLNETSEEGLFREEEFLDSSLSDNEIIERLEDEGCEDGDGEDKMEINIAIHSGSNNIKEQTNILLRRKKILPDDTKILPPEEQEVWQNKLSSWIKKQQHGENYNEAKSKPYVCDVCGKAYASTFSLKDHSVVHTGALNFKCDECGKKFGLKKNLTAHIKTKHAQCEMYYCDICGFGFNRKSNLKTHRWVHKDLKRYSCELCSKTFKWRNGLSIHINMHHGGGTKYSCYICGKTYLSSSSRGKHCRKAHGGLGMKPEQSIDEI